MKTSTLFCLLAITIIVQVSSCKKDDEKNPDIEVKDELIYSGKTYKLNVGNIVEYGFDNTHYNNEFYFMQFNEGENIVPVVLFIDLFSPTNDGFKGGTFNFIDTDEEVEVEKKYYFDDGQLYLNLNTTDETVIFP